MPLVAQALTTVLGPHMAQIAHQLHGLVWIVLAIAWGWPPLASRFRQIVHTPKDIHWVRFWTCPQCSPFVRSATLVCTHCEYHLETDFLSRWIPLWFSEGVRRGQKRFL